MPEFSISGPHKLAALRPVSAGSKHFDHGQEERGTVPPRRGAEAGQAGVNDSKRKEAASWDRGAQETGARDAWTWQAGEGRSWEQHLLRFLAQEAPRGRGFAEMPGEPAPQSLFEARNAPQAAVTRRMGLDQQAEAALGRLRLSRLMAAIQEMATLSRWAPPEARAEAQGAAKFVLRPLGLDKIV
ncbi:hypothetical protein KO491_12250 [Roseovarius nubinhibens]|uniref:hypothetical protein n=1 Tax=Roseovarius nubinhibens TaxID=314263 RepID=UPI001C098CA4|nr:hypothetical protein [Roseovarius nubinhibens]MBU3000607.1 hypothetical protein [Roseovarius nubinhibens]